MFHKKTVLILGAGASKPYGYPIGRELISGIIEIIENDKIFRPNSNTIGDLSFLSQNFTDFSARDFFLLKYM